MLIMFAQKLLLVYKNTHNLDLEDLLVTQFCFVDMMMMELIYINFYLQEPFKVMNILLYNVFQSGKQ